MRELFSKAELHALLQRDEGQFLEFKSLWDRVGSTRKLPGCRKVRDTIAEYVAARELRRLVEVEVLKRLGERRGAHYTPGRILMTGSEK